jgi:hypothetical protein
MLHFNHRDRAIFRKIRREEKRMKPAGYWKPMACLVLALPAVARGQLSYTTISDPLGVKGTEATGISDGTIVGFYYNSSKDANGFIYNGTNFTTLDDPFATGPVGTQPMGISGSTIVGTYVDSRTSTMRGFIYNGSTFTPLDEPNAQGETVLTGVSGSTYVGWYLNSSDQEVGFTYNGSTFTSLSDPSATGGTGIGGINSAGEIVGSYQDSNGVHGFTYNGSTFTNFNVPQTVSGDTTTEPLETSANGISGNLVVGSDPVDIVTNNNGITVVGDEYGFVYDGSNFITLDDPNAENQFGYGTAATGIDGDNVVGYYNVNSNTMEGFEVTVPEPTGGLLLLGAVVLLARRYRDAQRL